MSKSVDVETETTIRRPIEEVATFAAAPENATRWYANIHQAEWVGPPALAEGAEVRFVARFLGRRLAYTYKIVAYVPGRRLVMRTAEGPFPMETTYTWQAMDAATTRMTLRNRGEPRGFSRLAAPLMERAMRKANRHDLARLKQLLEGDAQLTAGTSPGTA